MITAQRVLKAAGKHVSRTLLGARSALGAARDRHCPACRRDVAGFFRYGAEGEWGCIACGASPRERLMHALLDAGRNDEALAAYDRAIALEPKMAEAYLGRAAVLKKLARLDDALASVDEAIAMKGDVGKMHEARASLLRDLGRDEDARAADARAAELAAKAAESNTSLPPAN